MAIDLPADLTAREAEIIETVTEDLRARRLLAGTDAELIRTYASAVVEAERLTRECRKWAPESQEFRRISAARDRAQRLVSTLATKLKITTRARAGEKPQGEPSATLLTLIYRDRYGRAETDEDRADVVRRFARLKQIAEDEARARIEAAA